MSENTLENRLHSLNQALSQMMRNTSEREIIDQLTTYKIAIQNTLKILTKKQITKIENSDLINDLCKIIEKNDIKLRRAVAHPI